MPPVSSTHKLSQCETTSRGDKQYSPLLRNDVPSNSAMQPCCPIGTSSTCRAQFDNSVIESVNNRHTRASNTRPLSSQRKQNLSHLTIINFDLTPRYSKRLSFGARSANQIVPLRFHRTLIQTAIEIKDILKANPTQHRISSYNNEALNVSRPVLYSTEEIDGQRWYLPLTTKAGMMI